MHILYIVFDNFIHIQPISHFSIHHIESVSNVVNIFYSSHSISIPCSIYLFSQRACAQHQTWNCHYIWHPNLKPVSYLTPQCHIINTPKACLKLHHFTRQERFKSIFLIFGTREWGGERRVSFF